LHLNFKKYKKNLFNIFIRLIYILSFSILFVSNPAIAQAITNNKVTKVLPITINTSFINSDFIGLGNAIAFEISKTLEDTKGIYVTPYHEVINIKKSYELTHINNAELIFEKLKNIHFDIIVISSFKKLQGKKYISTSTYDLTKKEIIYYETKEINYKNAFTIIEEITIEIKSKLLNRIDIKGNHQKIATYSKEPLVSLGKALIAIENGNVDLALNYVPKLRAEITTKKYSYYIEGLCFYYQVKPNDAIDALENSISGNYYFGTYELISEIYCTQAIDYEKALEQCQKGLNIKNDNLYLLRRRAWINMRIGMFDKAKNDLHKLKSTSKEDPEVLLIAAWIKRREEKKTNLDLRLIEKAYEIDPTKPNVLLNLGIFYLVKGLETNNTIYLDKAIPILQNAINNHKKIYPFHKFNESVIYEILSNCHIE